VRSVQRESSKTASCSGRSALQKKDRAQLLGPLSLELAYGSPVVLATQFKKADRHIAGPEDEPDGAAPSSIRTVGSGNSVIPHPRQRCAVSAELGAARQEQPVRCTGEPD
jgi:hypothetical protein